MPKSKKPGNLEISNKIHNRLTNIRHIKFCNLNIKKNYNTDLKQQSRKQTNIEI